MFSNTLMVVFDSVSLGLKFDTPANRNYLFSAPWMKNVIDYEKKHHHMGFTRLIKTTDEYVVSTTNFCMGNDETKKIDDRLSEMTQTEVSTHFVCILPKLSTGEHFDHFDKTSTPITTSLVSYISGEISVLQNGATQKVTPIRSPMINIQQLHEGINHSEHLAWCATTLFYKISYEDIKVSLARFTTKDFA